MSSADLNALPSILNPLNLSKTTKGEVKSEPLETFTLSRLTEINRADKEVADADDLISTYPQHATVAPLLRALWNEERTKDMWVLTADGIVIKCHRSIFKMASKFASELLVECPDDDVTSLFLPDFSSSSVEGFLKTLYCVTRVHSADIEIERLAESLKIKFSYSLGGKEGAAKKPGCKRLVRNPMSFCDSHFSFMPPAEYSAIQNDVKVDIIDNPPIVTKLESPLNVCEVEANDNEQSDEGEKATAENKTNDTPFHCPMCDRTFRRAKALRKHEREAHGEFKLSHEKRQKKKEVYMRLNPHACTTCDRRYPKVSKLREHERNYHTVKVCPTCGKSFTNRANLRQHELSHTRGKSFSCTLCDNKFTTKQYLKIHEKVKHGDGEKSFLCTQCDKMFITLSELKKHEFLHSGERPFECKVCQKTFTFKQTLERHEMIHTGEKPYKCSKCDKRFTQPGQLKRHELLHTGEKPFVCKTCGKSFAQNSHLTRHMKIHSV